MLSGRGHPINFGALSLAFILVSPIGSAALTDSPITIGALQLFIDVEHRSVEINSNNKEILRVSCDESSSCTIYSTNTYLVRYFGVDGGIDRTDSMVALNDAREGGITVFSIPEYSGRIIGFVKGVAGASGGNSQKLYLIDIDRAKILSVNSSDQVEPEWFTKNGNFIHLSKEYASLGPHCCPMGLSKVLRAVRVLDPVAFKFVEDVHASEDAYRHLMSEASLSQEDLDQLSGKTFSDITELWLNEWRAVRGSDTGTAETRENGGPFEHLMKRLVTTVYYARKLKDTPYLERFVFPSLDPTVIGEMEYLGS